MKKLYAVACLSLATLGLASGHAFAFGCKCCTCCCKYSICCRPYNAFSPVCCGNFCCNGCCGPCMPQQPCCSLNLGCGCAAGCVGGDCSCMGSLPAATGPVLAAPPATTGSTPAQNFSAPMPTPLPAGPATGAPDNQGYPMPNYHGMNQGYPMQPNYGYPTYPTAYGYPGMMPMGGMPMGGMPMGGMPMGGMPMGGMPMGGMPPGYGGYPTAHY